MFLTSPKPKSLVATKDKPSDAFGSVVDENSNVAVRLSSDSKALLEFFESPKIDACFEAKAILKYKRIRK